MTWIWIVPISGIISILFVVYLARDVLGRDTGTPEMTRVGETIFEGAVAFLRRQYQTIGLLAIVTAVIIAILIGIFERYSETNVTGMALGLQRASPFWWALRPRLYRASSGCMSLSSRISAQPVRLGMALGRP